MARKKDNTKLVWVGLAALGGYLWWKSQKTATASEPAASQPRVSSAPAPKPAAPAEENYITIPRSDYAYMDEQAGCLDLKSQQSVPIEYCDEAWDRYLES
jgi:hypothetical protein